jgi:hypothetical protein
MQCLSRSDLLRLRIQKNSMMLPRRYQVHLQSYLTNLSEFVPPPPHQWDKGHMGQVEPFPRFHGPSHTFNNARRASEDCLRQSDSGSDEVPADR